MACGGHDPACALGPRRFPLKQDSAWPHSRGFSFPAVRLLLHGISHREGATVRVAWMQNPGKLFGGIGGDRDPDKARRTSDAVVGRVTQGFSAGGTAKIDGDGFPGGSVHGKEG